MKRSTNRILTTHTGSLPRPPELIELIRARELGENVDEAKFEQTVRDAVKLTVQKQVDAGVDSVSDGEEGKPVYATYVKDRLTGFNGPSQTLIPPTVGEGADFPEFQERRVALQAGSFMQRPSCDGPVAWKDFSAVQRDIDNFKAALEGAKVEEGFMTAASPGVIAFFLQNQYYPSHEAYLGALADVMKDEYEAIVNAGFLLQIDCPDLAMSRQSRFVDKTLSEFRDIVELHVETINRATANIDPEMMRIHLCWGNYEGPHHLDVPLKDIIDLVLKSRPNAISFEGANPRHAHEWNVWEQVTLPPEKIVVPGVIDSTSNFVEHPELIAQRIVQYAKVVGKERVIASSDCGFGTNAASTVVDARVAWAKMASMAEGAKIASKQLWG
jgi:5-methyltetrahydropteroyltriglutamate--homocysteine methyltransferase